MKPKKSARSPHHAKFAKALLARRKERGYPTAYSFYHKNGGRKTFDFSYHHYLLIEKGMRLPSQNSLKAIIKALGLDLVGFYPERKELLIHFVKALLNGDEIFDPVFKKPSPGEGGESPTESYEAELLKTAATRQLSEVPRMTKEQGEALTTSPGAFWVLNYLLQTGLYMSKEKIQVDLGIPEPEITQAIDLLLKHDLINRRKDGSFETEYAEQDLFVPVSVYTNRFKWISETIQQKVKTLKANPSYYAYVLMSVEDEERLATVYNMFRDALRKMYLLRQKPPVHSGKLVAIEARVCPILDIEE